MTFDEFRDTVLEMDLKEMSEQSGLDRFDFDSIDDFIDAVAMDLYIEYCDNAYYDTGLDDEGDY